jgi:hypothetical protein
VQCHKLVIAAHSNFIKNTLLSIGNDDTICQIKLPDFSKSSVEYLVEYLYRGRLMAPLSQKNVLRDLFVDILKIDPRFDLPDSSKSSMENFNEQTDLAIMGNNDKVCISGQFLSHAPTFKLIYCCSRYKGICRLAKL